MTDATYTIYGGPNFALPTPGEEGESFDTLDAALDEWLRRRNDWTNRYPCWGDGIEADSYIVVLGTEVESFDGWTIASGRSSRLGRDLDELYNYLEPADIARRAVAPTGASDHQQILWALRAYEGFTPEPTLPGMPTEPSLTAADEVRGREIRKDFPELERIAWDGGYFDFDAMGVDPEWAEELVRELELTGVVQWIDSEPFVVGVDVLREQLEGSAR
jgi:hypothetical protein